MIVTVLLNIGVTILGYFLFLVNAVLPSLPTMSIPSGLGYVFGNIYLFNDFLPVTDLFIAFGFAVVFKLAIMTFKVVLYVLELFNTVRRTFLTLRG